MREGTAGGGGRWMRMRRTEIFTVFYSVLQGTCLQMSADINRHVQWGGGFPPANFRTDYSSCWACKVREGSN